MTVKTDVAYRAERYDKDSTRILCAGGWVVAMIERLSNDRWVICVGDQRYAAKTFASANAAFGWWKSRHAETGGQ